MRISKEPEVRRQEIIDTAMRVFSEQGYEATTMKDIAREMKVASGLCYHYFPNKQELYETAVDSTPGRAARDWWRFSGGRASSESLEQLGNVWKAGQDGEACLPTRAFFSRQGQRGIPLPAGCGGGRSCCPG